MWASGALLAIAGVWVISQVFAGDALRRMNIVPNSESGPKDRDGIRKDGGWIDGAPDPGDVPGVPDGLPSVPRPPGGITPYLPGGARNPFQWL